MTIYGKDLPKSVYTQAIRQTAHSAGLSVIHQNILVAQGALESEHFTSNLFRTDNNFCGMKVPKIRGKKYQDGPSKIIRYSEGPTPYAHYDSVERCTLDLIDLMTYNRINWETIKTPADYSRFLKSKDYYQASEQDYTRIINNLYKKYFNV